MISKQLYLFDCLGFYRVPGVFPKAMIDEANFVVDTALRDNKYEQGKFNETVNYWGIYESHPIFSEFLIHPEVKKICEICYGGPKTYRLDHGIIAESHPHEKHLKGIVHGEHYGKLGSHFYTSQGQPHAETPCFTRVGQLTVGVCLKGQDPRHGGFFYLPGSHKSSYYLPGQHVQYRLFKEPSFGPDAPHFVVPRLRAGDLFAFPESLIHGQMGMPNANGPRRFIYSMMYSLPVRFMDWDAQIQRMRKMVRKPEVLDVVTMVPKDTMDYNGPRQQFLKKNNLNQHAKTGPDLAAESESESVTA